MKKIFISGISSGFGKSLAEVFGDTGWTVIGCGRSQINFPKENIYYFEMDISDWNQIEDFIAHHQSLLEDLSVMIHNASILGMLETLDKYPPPTWKKVVDINLTGGFYLIRALSPFLKKADLPQVIIMTSSVAIEPREKWGAYSVSKAGLEALAKILSRENPDWIVYTVNPGGLPTRMRHMAYPDEDPNTLPSLEDAALQLHQFVEFPDITWKGIHINLRDFISPKQ